MQDKFFIQRFDRIRGNYKAWKHAKKIHRFKFIVFLFKVIMHQVWFGHFQKNIYCFCVDLWKICWND